MTWTKLGDEFPSEARDLTSDEFRTHVEALCWSAFRLLDLRIPKRDVRRFAEADDPDQAVKGLVAKGWWADLGDEWDVGLRFAEWQLERSVVENRRDLAAERQRRRRKHKAGDHSSCLPENCQMASVTRDVTRDDMRDPGRDGSGPTVPPVPESKDLGERQNRNFAAGGEVPPAGGVGAGAPTDRNHDQRRSVANSPNPRVHDGTVNRADDAHHDGPSHSPRSAADRNARASEPDAWDAS